MVYTCSHLALCLGCSPRSARRFARIWSQKPREEHVRFHREDLEAAIAAWETRRKRKTWLKNQPQVHLHPT